MEELLNGCKQYSHILVPFKDTLIAANTLFLLSTMGTFLLSVHGWSALFVYGPYVCKTDSDNVLTCESKDIAEQTISTQTTRCQEALDSMDAESRKRSLLKQKINRTKFTLTNK